MPLTTPTALLPRLRVLAVLAFALPALHARRPISGSARCGAARVAISVSPLVRSREMRMLELSWNYDGAQPGDQVALYDYDPVLRRQWDDANNRNEPVPDATRNIPVSSPGSSSGSSLRSSPEGTPGSSPGLSPSGPSSGYNPGAPPAYTPGSSPGSPPGYYPGAGAPALAPDPYRSNNPYGGQYVPGPGVGVGSGGGPYYGPNPYPYNGWSGNGNAGVGQGSGAPFPLGYPRDGFSGRQRREEGREGGPPLAVVHTDGRKSGWGSSGVQEMHIPSGQLGYKSRCLNYWAAYERPRPGGTGENQTEVLAVSCLRTRPTWMADFRGEIGRLRLVDLFIPGTHDSASAQEDGRNNIIDKYTVTQDESILGQLIYGVRYIDLRVGFYPSKSVQWWANHGPVRMQPLLSVLHDVKAFMGNTNEIVILDLQNFPAGFGDDNMVHLKLVHLLETELGELMAPRELGWQSRLDEVWSSGGRRLIVAYDKEDVLPASRKLWPAVRQFWGDAQTPEQLFKFASSIMGQPFRSLRGFAWALMAELTPNARLIATNPTGSLRRLAHRVNRNVTSWAEGPWGEAMQTLAVDFVRSTGVVEAAVWHNLRRGGVDECAAHRLLGSV